MSLIAGYVDYERRSSRDLIRGQIESFSIVTTENLRNYNTHILPIDGGHLILSHKIGYPIQNDPVTDSHNNVLITLGFMRFTQSLNNAKKIFDRCINEGSAIIERCEGEFIAVFYNNNSKHLHIVNDRFASRPIYVMVNKKQFYFSSNFAFLLHFIANKPKPDILGWLQLFNFEVPIDTRTTFDTIKRLKPASHLVYANDRISYQKYWNIKLEANESLCPDEHSRKTFEAFRKGAEFRANLVDKGVLALSGGMDSRLVAGGLPKDHGFKAFTFIDTTEDKATTEVESAIAIGKILGLDHHIEKIAPNLISSAAKDIILLTGGLISIQHSAKVMSYINHIKSKGFGFLLGGGPGNVISGPMMPELSLCMSPEKIEEGKKAYLNMKLFGGDFNKYIMNKIIRKDILKEYYHQVIESLSESFESVSGPTLGHRIMEWTLGCRSHAYTFTSPIHNHPDLTEAFCHLDYAFCDLMLKIPIPWFYKRNFYEYMIYKNIQQLQSVKYANTGNLLSGEIKQYHPEISASSQSGIKFYLKQYLKKNKYAGQFYKKSLYIKKRYKIMHNNHNVTPHFHYFLFRKDKSLFSDLSDILHSISSLKDLLDIEGCINFIDAFENGKIVTLNYDYDTRLLGCLSTICYTYKYFDL